MGGTEQRRGEGVKGMVLERTSGRQCESESESEGEGESLDNHQDES